MPLPVSGSQYLAAGLEKAAMSLRFGVSLAVFSFIEGGIAKVVPIARVVLRTLKREQ